MTRDLVDQMGGGHGRPPRDASGDSGSQDSESVELTMVLHYDTGRAVLVSQTGEEANAIWLPHSQIEMRETGKRTQATKKNGQTESVPVVELTLPEWLAKKNGLI